LIVYLCCLCCPWFGQAPILWLDRRGALPADLAASPSRGHLPAPPAHPPD
jgi:hypothetical protein